jgi:hypothetical protein
LHRPQGGGAFPDPLTWPVTARDGCSTTRQFTGSVTNLLTGEVTPQTHTVIQVATGLNYQDASGTWQESQDLIVLTPDGGAAALQGPLNLYFSPAGLSSDTALTIITPDQQALTARVQGVYLFDSQSGQSSLLAAPSDSAVAELLPPNQIIYRSAFNSDVFQADLRYTYTKAGFESDVIITRQPKTSPEDCGLNPATTLLQVRHQWQNAPAPAGLRQITVGQETGGEMPDQFIDLGEMFFPPGRALVTDGTSSTDTSVPAQIGAANPQSAGAGVPVGKEWQAGGGPGGSSLLIESVSWQSIATSLTSLPLMAQADDSPWTDFLAGAAAGSILLADQPSRTPELLLDYVVYVSGDYTNFTFQSYSPGSGPTYFVDSTEGSATFVCPGTVTFQPNCVIKFVGGTGLISYGSIQCNGTQNSPSVLTSEYDQQYGDSISGGIPAAGDIGTGLYIDYAINTFPILNGLAIRYATTAIEWQANCRGNTNTIANCAFYECGTGLYANGANVVIQNSAVSQVTTPLTLFGCDPNVFGSFGQGQAPVFTTNPGYQVVEQGNNVTFTAALSPATAACYQWDSYSALPGGGMGWQPITGATSPSLTLASPTDGTQVKVYGGNPFGSPGASSEAEVFALDATAWAVWENLIAGTNGETPSIWASLSWSDPTDMAWNPNSLIYGKRGWTAISQLNSWNLGTCDCPCQIPITALTGRHGYACGHAFGSTSTNQFNPLSYPCVWFCDPYNNVVQVNIPACIVRHDADHDYTVFLFDRDVSESGITPMYVGSVPQGDAVLLATCQTAYGEVPGCVYLASPASNFWVPQLPFLPQIYKGGDSGSPIMVPTTNNALVFISGTYSSGPSSDMQTDMDTLSVMGGLNPASYQMNWQPTE